MLFAPIFDGDLADAGNRDFGFAVVNCVDQIGRWKQSRQRNVCNGHHWKEM
jgi:hypothetical protein